MVCHSENMLIDFPITELVNLEDINVGGLYGIYERNTNPVSMCSEELNYLSILKAYSMVYIIEMLNKNLFLPSHNISIGYYILPTCSHVGTAQIQSIIQNIIRNKIGLPGLIGPLKSLSAYYVSPLLSYYRLPHISPEASSVELKGQKFNYLFRITSNQILYLNALLSLLRLFQWSEVAIIYSSTPYFAWFRDQLNAATTREKFCIWHEIEIETFNVNMSKASFEALVNKTKARVIFLFLHDYQFGDVLKSIHSINSDPDFIYIGIDTWPSTEQLVRLGLAKMVEGAITVFQFGSDSANYSSWLLNKDKIIDPYHPWFNSIRNRLLNHENDTLLNLNTSNGIKLDKRISLSMDATMALLFSIDDLIRKKCSNINKSQLKNCIIDNNLKPYLLNVSFYGMSGKIDFNSDRSVNNPLRIGNFLKFNSRYDLYTVGSYESNKENGSQLKLISNFTWRNYTYYNNLTAPTSRCSAPCQINEYKMSTSSKCCWTCRTCNERSSIFTPQYQLRMNNFRRCLSCPSYKWPSLNRTVCINMPIINIRHYTNYWKLINVIAFIGILFAITMVIFYIQKYQSTPFKLEFRSLLYLQYVGIFFGFISAFLVTSPQPDKPKCGIALSLFLLSVSLIFGSLSSKQNIIVKRLRINKPGFKDIKYEKRALITAILICSVQIFVVASYFMMGNSSILRVENFTKYISRSKNTNNSDTTPLVSEYCSPYPINNGFLIIELCFQMLILMYLCAQTIQINLKFTQAYMEIKNLQINILSNVCIYILGVLIYFSLPGIVSIIVLLIIFIIFLYVQIFFNTISKIIAMNKMRQLSLVAS
ncbi:unnamed protein product [Gordionus sp. m RMFG-2023]